MGLNLDARDRRSVRRAVRAACQVVTEHGFQLLGQIALDLSTDGLLVSSDVTVPAGEPVLVSLRIPGTTIWIDAEGTVTRVVAGTGVGVRFDRLDADARALLSSSLRGFPPPIPTARPRRDYAAAVRAIAFPVRARLATI
jgi:hypothetical protein